ncbi:MAG: PIN domain-containing protein [Bryobacteraceae bacterium]
MRTAIDANVISAVWSVEPLITEMIDLLDAVQAEGGLVICGPVYAELLAHPRATREFVDRFLADNDIAVEFALHEDIWIAAGEAYAAYARRRRKSDGGEPRRLLVDFVIGAHALIRADRLATPDRSHYANAFPQLTLLG